MSRSQPDLFSSVEEDDNAEVATATAAAGAAAAAAADASARRAAEKLAANQIKVRQMCIASVFWDCLGRYLALHRPGFWRKRVRASGRSSDNDAGLSPS